MKGFWVHFKDGSDMVRFLLLKMIFSSHVEDSQLEKGLGEVNPVRKIKC